MTFNVSSLDIDTIKSDSNNLLLTLKHDSSFNNLTLNLDIQHPSYSTLVQISDLIYQV